MVWETIATALGLKLGAKAVDSGSSWVQEKRERKRMEKCGHVTFHRHPEGLYVRMSTTPVGVFHHQCWQCGLIAPRDAFVHQMSSTAEAVTRDTGWTFRIVEE